MKKTVLILSISVLCVNIYATEMDSVRNEKLVITRGYKITNSNGIKLTNNEVNNALSDYLCSA